MPPSPPPAHLVLDLLPDAVCVVDAEGRFQFVNPAFEHTLGYPSSQVIGRRVFDFLHPEDLAATLRQVDRIMAGHHQRHFRNRYRHQDGHYVDMQWSARWHPEHGVRIAVGREVTELRRAELALEHQARHDPLTGLPNRRHLLQELHGAIGRARESATGLAVLFIDMDGFKAINDRFGHEIGDKLLHEVASRLAHSVQPPDLAARVGGDEFVIIKPGCADLATARAAAADIGARLGLPYCLPAGKAPLSASIGVSLFPRDGVDPCALLAHADQDMYAVKGATRTDRA